jgi:hypothetical protein
MYGYQDSGDLAPGKQGGKFGLNTGAFVTKFEYNPNAGSDGSAGDAIDLTIQIGEREYRHRFFPISKVFKDGSEITDTNSQEYKDGIAKETSQLNAMLTDIVKVFVDEETLKTALATPISSFKNYAEILQRLVQSAPNWQKVPVDVFLQYQWKPSGDNDRTYLELPKNVKHGLFITKSFGEGFVEERTSGHLKYVNEEGIQHPFKRGEWFLGSAFANQTNLSGNAGAGSIEGGTTENTW